MTLWLILTIMTSVAAILLSAPFIRRFGGPQADTAADIEVYRDQLKEIENDLRHGMIDDAQADAARIEIKRRALAADRVEQSAMPRLSHSERSFAMICVAAIVVFGSVALYAITVNPELPSTRGFVAAQRTAFADAQESSSVESSAATAQSSGSESPLQPRPQAGLPPVDEMIRRLAARLARNPNDAEGWRTLGWSYASTGRLTEADEAYAKAIELNPDVADIGHEDARGTGTMLPADRSAMIRGMVDGLANRLERSPRDADGWIKLIRSRVALGESNLAKQALTRGLEVFADDGRERDRIAAAAQQLGLSP
jgi:cytochrome c-type biogenesis protein CcmH